MKSKHSTDSGCINSPSHIFTHLLTYDVGGVGIPCEIRLSLDGQEIHVIAKLDTGASHSIFARTYGEKLGLDIESGFKTVFDTATGTFTTFGHEVTLQIGDIQLETMVFFARDEFFSRNVIGRIGVLDRLVVGLIDYEGKLFLGRYGDN